MQYKRLSLLATALCVAGVAAHASRDSAAALLRASGVQGGLIVHVACGDGATTVPLCAGSAFRVHALSTDAAEVRAVRERVLAAGLGGTVTADLHEGREVPVIDGVVNLLVDGRTESTTPRAELMRVLAPRGVALVKGADVGDAVTIGGETWRRVTRPVPTGHDEWTHYLHGPDNNAVSQDTVVSHPYHMQWAGFPVWTRNHNHMNGYSALVSTGGRVFYILDDGPIQSVRYTPRWELAARDAYNGIVLWRRRIENWEGHLRPFRSGPAELPRRLVAVGDRVFVTLGYGEPLSILDAATGEDVRGVPGTEGTHEIIHADGVLYLVAGAIDQAAYRTALSAGQASPPIRGKRILAVAAATGDILWQKRDAATAELLPTTLCADDGRLFYQGIEALFCLEAASGKELWRTPRPVAASRKGWSAPTVVVRDGVVLCAEGSFKASGGGRKGKPLPPPQDPSKVRWTVTASPNSSEGGELIAFRATDGAELWRCPAAFGYSSPPNVLVADGLVWVNREPGINRTDMTEGRDLRTGEVKRTIDTAAAFDCAHHHRCYRDKASERFLLLGRTGVEMVDLATREVQRHFWIRGTCQYGLMPANGLLYLPGHSCGCYIQSKLNGFWAVAPKRAGPPPVGDGPPRLQRGPAWGTAPTGTPVASDWPMHRYDNGRSSSTPTPVPARLSPVWRTEVGGALTAPVIAGGRVIVALKDRHVIAALDASTGKRAWTFAAGGRIDSAPTISRGLVVFGANDGFVTCLRLTDGALVWRYRVAPADRRTMAFGQLESLWPVVGSVSVVDTTVYCVAGRSSYLDGGMALCRLDLATGREVGRTQLYSRDPQTGRQPDDLLEDVELPGALPDILTFQGDRLFLRDKQFDLQGREKAAEYRPHLYSSAGLLNGDWWHRTIWIWGERAFGRASGWAIAGRYRPSGRLLVTDDALVYGYTFNDRNPRRPNQAKPGSMHGLFCADKEVVRVDRVLKNNNSAVTAHMTPDKIVRHWTHGIDFAVRGMVKAGDTLVLAGPEDVAEIPFDDPSHPAVLGCFSATTGEAGFRTALPCQPVFDGMSVAGGRVYIALIDGALACYGEVD